MSSWLALHGGAVCGSADPFHRRDMPASASHALLRYLLAKLTNVALVSSHLVRRQLVLPPLVLLNRVAPVARALRVLAALEHVALVERLCGLLQLARVARVLAGAAACPPDLGGHGAAVGVRRVVLQGSQLVCRRAALCHSPSSCAAPSSWPSAPPSRASRSALRLRWRLLQRRPPAQRLLARRAPQARRHWLRSVAAQRRAGRHLALSLPARLRPRLAPPPQPQQTCSHLPLVLPALPRLRRRSCGPCALWASPRPARQPRAPPSRQQPRRASCAAWWRRARCGVRRGGRMRGTVVWWCAVAFKQRASRR